MNTSKRFMPLLAALGFFVALLSFYYRNLVLPSVILTVVLIAVLIILEVDYKYIISVVLISALGLSILFTYQKIDKINSFENMTVSATFIATEDSAGFENYSKVTVITESGNLPKNFKFFLIYFNSSVINSGDKFVADVNISTLDSSEYKAYNYGNSVYASLSTDKINKIDEKNLFYGFTGKIRTYVKTTLAEKFSPNISALLTALIIGDKSTIDVELSENIKLTGISHVIVVSGLHLSIILGGLFKILDRLLPNKYIRSLISVISVFMISAICSFTMSVIRASVMYLFAAAAPLLNRENDSFNSLGSAVMAVLIASPFSCLNLSFQLSVLATLAIVWVAPFYKNFIVNIFGIKSKILDEVIGILIGSLAAVIFTMPVCIKTFGYVSVIAPITNLLITYPISWALSFGVAAVLLSIVPFFSVCSTIFFVISGCCVKYIIYVINLLSKLPVTTINLPTSSFWLSIVLILLIIGLMYLIDYKNGK